MNLIVVESPTKARTLGRFLGKDYDIVATMGHIMDLPKSTLGVDIENNFRPDYRQVEKRSKEVAIIKSKAKAAKVVFLASDPDREGEAIASHVKELIGDGKTKRIVFHEITESAVKDAINNSHEIDTRLVNAQIARRVLDRLVGYKLSPLLWKKVRRGLSAGRVQTVAVRLIVDREREIEAFKALEYWEIFCDIKEEKSESFTVKLIKVNSKNAEISNQSQAENVVNHLKKSQFSVLDVIRKEVRKNPYPPFTTSTMTQAGARVFGWPSRRTMSVAQKLYEEGLITYHRTDSLNLSKEAVELSRAYIKKNYGPGYLPDSPKYYKTKSRSAQEAHEAIRPTKVDSSPSALDLEPSANRLYELIWKRFLACQMNPSIYDQTTIDVLAKSSNNSSDVYSLRATGQIMKFDGWKVLYPNKEDNSGQSLPAVAKDDPLQLIKVDPKQNFTQPPPRYNEASLIKTMEKLGIGRPSTYAPTISTIETRKYVEKTEGRFYPTAIGIAVNDFLINNFSDTFDYQFTAGMELNLDKIADSSLKWTKIISDFYRPFEKKLLNVEKTSKRVKIEVEKLGKKCPDCKEGELVIRTGRFGKFISCSRFPDCKYTAKFIEKLGINCPECGKGDVVIKTTKKGRKFYGCSRYPDCSWASWQKPANDKAELNK